MTILQTISNRKYVYPTENWTLSMFIHVNFVRERFFSTYKPLSFGILSYTTVFLCEVYSTSLRSNHSCTLAAWPGHILRMLISKKCVHIVLLCDIVGSYHSSMLGGGSSVWRWGTSCGVTSVMGISDRITLWISIWTSPACSAARGVPTKNIRRELPPWRSVL